MKKGMLLILIFDWIIIKCFCLFTFSFIYKKKFKNNVIDKKNIEYSLRKFTNMTLI